VRAAVEPPQRVLIDIAIPVHSVPGQLAVILGSSVLVAAAGRLTIPLPWVPLTGQTYAVLLVAALLGGRRGMLAMLAYLAEGLLGLPVFAAGHSAWTPSSVGVPTIIGPTAGYLLVLPLVGLLVGSLAERGWDRRPARAVLAMALGSGLIYLGGVSWLTHYLDLSRALQVGLFPFLVGDSIKVALAAVTLPLGWRLVGASASTRTMET